VPGAERILERLDLLAQISSEPDALTRLAFTPEMARANALVESWMQQAGMATWTDAAGNLMGRIEGRRRGLPALMLGSHLDTVRNAGKYDGMLGIVTALDCIERLKPIARALPFAVELACFGDEEGVRFGTTVLGSFAACGLFRPERLDLVDENGISAREAITAFGLSPDRIGEAARSSAELVGYLELHIEQGPVLEDANLPAALVSGIVGSTRGMVTVRGEAGHAGTVPMAARRDALAGAAEMLLALESLCAEASIVGTAGRLDIANGATNVIPGTCRFSVDIRALDDATRAKVVSDLRLTVQAIAARRGLDVAIDIISSNETQHCSAPLQSAIASALSDVQLPPLAVPSGAGHDGAHLAAITGFGMIFLLCRKGISHNPLEFCSAEDIALGAEVLLRSIYHLADRARD